MHVVDAGGGEEGDIVKLRCHRCGYDDGWREMGMAKAKRGVPCPRCN